MNTAGRVVLDIKPYPQQADFIDSTARFTAFIAGIGAGKSYAGAVKALLASLQTKGLGLVVAPTYPMLRDSTVRMFREVAGPLVPDAYFHRGEMRARVLGGGEVLFRSADKPDRLRGPNISWAWIDEAALCPDKTWEVVIGRLREKGHAGPVWVTTTPKGRNWLYQRLGLIQVFRAKTWDNPYLDREFVESLKAAYSGKFALQELEGEFVSFEGLVYDEFSPDIHLVKSGSRYKKFPRWIGGIDAGYTNPAVLLTAGVDSDGRLWVIEEIYRRRLQQDDFVAQVVKTQKRFPFERVAVDPAAAGLIASLREAGVPVVAADNRVMDGIQAVKGRLKVAGDGKPRLFVSTACANTIAEFGMYTWQERAGGFLEKPAKFNDHAMDALRYAVMMEEKPMQAEAVENPFY